MGQAKNRGSFRERKARAIKRDEKIIQAEQEIRIRRSPPKLERSRIALMAATIMATTAPQDMSRLTRR